VITEADTTNAAVTAMRSASIRMMARSEDMIVFSYPPLEGKGKIVAHTLRIVTETFGPCLMV
jgi:hypothetical protein